jgi:dTDP-4-dehydrorhamnose reductase
MRILVTGASGLLGINLALEAAKKHTVYGLVNQHQIRIPDKRLSDNIRTDNIRIIQADLLAPGALDRVLDQVQPDWIVHCAALAIVDACEADPKLAQQLNTHIPGKLAFLTKNGAFNNVARGGARLLHISTDAVFDGRREGIDDPVQFYEDDEPNPLNTYAQTKLEGERAVLETDPHALVARVNLVGWSISGKRSLAEFFYYNLQAGRRVMGFTDVFFCPLLANQLAEILLAMLENHLKGLYHVVSSETISKYEYGLRLAKRFGLDESLVLPASVKDSSLAASRSPWLSLSIEKITRDLGIQPPGIDQGIEGLFRLHQQGYPKTLLAMADSDNR